MRLWPNAEVTVLARSGVAEVFSARESPARVVEYREGSGVHRLRRLLHLGSALRRERFSLALILPNSFVSGLLVCMAGIPQRVGYATDGRGWLLTHKLKSRRKERGLHQADYYLELIRSLGGTAVDRTPRLTLKASLRERGSRLSAALDIGADERVVGVHAGATYGEAKRWFPERFAAVLDRLQRQGLRVLLLGGPGEEPVAAQISGLMERPPISLVGRTSVGEAVALIGRCAMFLSNDSGLMHVAAALGIPQVAVFGSTDPEKSAPLNELAVVIQPRGLSCAPCFKRRCPYNLECMRAISVDEVHAAAERLLGRRDRRRLENSKIGKLVPS
jgi:heptosyltransferase-2